MRYTQEPQIITAGERKPPKLLHPENEFRKHIEECIREEGRGTRNGYEASKGSKGILGL